MHALDRSPCRWTRRDGRGDGAERIGQSTLRRSRAPAGADRRRGARARCRAGWMSRNGRAGCAAHGRRCVPGLQPGCPVSPHVENVSLPLELDGPHARKARAAWVCSTGETRAGRAGRAAIVAELSGGGTAAGGDRPRRDLGQRGCCWPTSSLRRARLGQLRGGRCACCTRRARTQAWPRLWSTRRRAARPRWSDRVAFLRDAGITDQAAQAPGPESLLTPGGPQ